MKVTKRQLRRIIKEERAKLNELGEDIPMLPENELEYAVDEFVEAAVKVGMTADQAENAIMSIVRRVLDDSSLAGGDLDRSRYIDMTDPREL